MQLLFIIFSNSFLYFALIDNAPAHDHPNVLWRTENLAMDAIAFSPDGSLIATRLSDTGLAVILIVA